MFENSIALFLPSFDKYSLKIGIKALVTAEPKAMSKKSKGIRLALEKATASLVFVPYIAAITISRSIPHTLADSVAKTMKHAVSAVFFLVIFI